jgi:hypothetical protein
VYVGDLCSNMRTRFEVRKATLADVLRGSGVGLQLNEHFHEAADVIFRPACQLGCVSRSGSARAIAPGVRLTGSR